MPSRPIVLNKTQIQLLSFKGKFMLISFSEQEYDKEQLRIMRNAFKAFDHDDKGFIEHADVIQILEILGQKLDDKAVKALIKEVDKGNSGKLDFKQFCKLASRFVEVDEDGPVLMVATLRGILHELDDNYRTGIGHGSFEEIDADGSGTVDLMNSSSNEW
ncbi:hypothetical protein DOY81_009543 [Sarcophaga bullata]|nr:hypothetical protein DOY81_009543 [Sarcophaga bullata]